MKIGRRCDHPSRSVCDEETMADRRTGLLALGVEQIKQYPGPEQVELKVDCTALDILELQERPGECAVSRTVHEGEGRWVTSPLGPKISTLKVKPRDHIRAN